MKLFPFRTFIFLFVLYAIPSIVISHLISASWFHLLHYISLPNRSFFFFLMKQTSKYPYRYHEIGRCLKNRLTVAEVLSRAAFFKLFSESPGSIYLCTQTLMSEKRNLECLQHISELHGILFLRLENGTSLQVNYIFEK